MAVAALATLGLAGEAAAQVGGSAWWPLRSSNQDSVSRRSAGLTGTPARLQRLVLSNGAMPTSGTTTPAYSSVRGQAFAPAADGSGWPSTAGGPGSLPRRTYYEQFSVTVNASTRFDSLLFRAVATSSPGGRIALMYSLSNFATDSSNVTGGSGIAYPGYTSGMTVVPTFNGGPLPVDYNGTFPTTNSYSTTPAVLSSFANATGNNGQFRFELNGPGGLVLNAGQTLTVRLYPSINNSSPGRYVLLRDVILKGRAGGMATTATHGRSALNLYPNPAQDRLAISHPAAQAGARLTLYSATGSLAATVATRPGTLSTELSLADLARGIYLVEYSDGTQRSTAKVVKE